MKEMTDRPTEAVPSDASSSPHNQILQDIASDMPLPHVLTSLAEYVESEMASDVKCAIAVLDTEQETLHLRAAPSLSPTYTDGLRSLPVGPASGTYGASVLTNAAAYSTNVRENPEWSPLAASLSADAIAACWTLPIRNTTHDVIGTLSLHSSEQRGPTSSEQSIAETASLLSSIAIERKRQKETIATLEAEQQQRAYCDYAFLGMMNHELRTPLTSILGFASILNQEAPLALQPFAQTIERNGQQLLKHIESVLFALSLKSDEEQPDLAKTDLEEMLQPLITEWLTEAHIKGLSFLISQPQTLQPIVTDATWIQRILVELLRNAFAFTPLGTISLRILQTETMLQFEVEDTGVGISEAFLPNVFTPYQQEKMGWDRTHIGIGLGLTIVERMVSKLGGTVRAKSQQRVGSCFTVTLPVMAALD